MHEIRDGSRLICSTRIDVATARRAAIAVLEEAAPYPDEALAVAVVDHHGVPRHYDIVDDTVKDGADDVGVIELFGCAEELGDVHAHITDCIPLTPGADAFLEMLKEKRHVD